jgi:hypothetical protein
MRRQIQTYAASSVNAIYAIFEIIEGEFEAHELA